MRDACGLAPEKAGGLLGEETDVPEWALLSERSTLRGERDCLLAPRPIHSWSMHSVGFIAANTRLKPIYYSTITFCLCETFVGAAGIKGLTRAECLLYLIPLTL